MKRIFSKRRSGATPHPRERSFGQGDPEVASRAGIKPGGATTSHAAAPFNTRVLQHLQVFFYSLGQLSRTPLSTLMTATVIGIALALPTELYVVLNNAQKISSGWEGGSQISLFLKQELSDDEALRLAEQVRALPGVSSVVSLSRTQALEEFRELSGFGQAIDELEENPLPAVLIVSPALTQALLGKDIQDALDVTGALLAKLRTLPGVDIAQANMQWLQRLYAIMAVAQRAVLMLGALLALGVLLIVGNTIRLAIYSRRDEIEIIKLIGATDGFIRRPFLYSGLWYGIFGGIIAWCLVSLSLWFLQGPVKGLSALYNSSFSLSGLDGLTSLLLLSIGGLLGLCGSALAVKRHLAAIEPV